MYSWSLLQPDLSSEKVDTKTAGFVWKSIDLQIQKSSAIYCSVCVCVLQA